MIGKEEAKEIFLNYCHDHQRERGFRVAEMQVPDGGLFEFEEGYVIYAIPQDPDDVIIPNFYFVVEKEGGNIFAPRPTRPDPNAKGPVEHVIKAYREMVSK